MKQDNGERDKVFVKSADRIKRKLRRRELSYRETALRIGSSPATVSRIANQDGRVISERAAMKLARLLDEDFDDLFGDETFHVSRDYARRNRIAA